MNKAERLVVAGVIAPVLRGANDGDRRIAIVDKDGNIVGYRSLKDVRKKLLERAKIELDVGDGVRPKVVMCKICGAIIRVTRNCGLRPTRCRDRCLSSCAHKGCGARAPSWAFAPSGIAKRGGRPWVCRRHAMTPKQRGLRVKPGRGEVIVRANGTYLARLPRRLGMGRIGAFPTQEAARAALDAKIAELEAQQTREAAE